MNQSQWLSSIRLTILSVCHHFPHYTNESRAGVDQGYNCNPKKNRRYSSWGPSSNQSSMVPWRFFKNLPCSSGCIWIWSTSFKVPIIQHNPTILSRVFPKSSKSRGYPQIIQVPSPTKFYATICRDLGIPWGTRTPRTPRTHAPLGGLTSRNSGFDLWWLVWVEIIGKSNAKPLPNWSDMDGIKWYKHV